MPVAGRKPKPPGQARNKNKPMTEWTEVLDVPYEGDVPDLPPRTAGWPDRVVTKWQAWSSMPHCILWTRTDWEFALDSLAIAAKFYEGDTKAATELRNREKLLGTTFDFRRDLRIRYVDSITQQAQDEGEGIVNIDEFRNRG